jgi:hypothetical protein
MTMDFTLDFVSSLPSLLRKRALLVLPTQGVEVREMCYKLATPMYNMTITERLVIRKSPFVLSMICV